MNEERLLQVLIAPHFTEKSSRVTEKHRQHVFKVAKDSTKREIKAAIKKLFKVDVESVTTVNIEGKSKRFGRFDGQRNGLKKAYVTLAEGHDINFSEM